MASGILKVIQRRKVYDDGQLDSTPLKRCLNVWDLTALGVGSTLGVGVYVVLGAVAVNVAGPAVTVSFLIAAFVALLAGLCYAEIGARIPRAGASYTYVYCIVGELAAFIVGWNMILEGIFGTASVARGLSMYVDSLSNNTMSEWFQSFAPINTTFFSPYFDFFSFFIVLILGAVVAFDVRGSTVMNGVFTVINIGIICFIIFAGAFRANADNWRLSQGEVEPGYGEGGFFPYGVLGMVKGVAYCFYGFVGFEAIGSGAEEVVAPRRTIPRAIFLMLAILCMSYITVATVVTMMAPYYMQETVAGVATVFSTVGWEWARWIVGIGAIFGILASMFGALFPLPRLLYAMSSDGLMFPFLGRVTRARRSPAIATLIPTAVIAIIAGTFVLEELLSILCIGTLLSYTMVAVCVVLLRYRSETVNPTRASCLRQIFGCGDRTPSRYTSRIVTIQLILFVTLCAVTSAVVGYAGGGGAALGGGGALVGGGGLLVLLIALQPRAGRERGDTFTTPLVPLVPCLSIAFNVYLMIVVGGQTWVRVLVWLAIGIPVYLLFLCIYKQNKFSSHLESNINEGFSNIGTDGKPPVRIVVEEPTPLYKRRSIVGDDDRRDRLSEELIADMKEIDMKVATETVTVAAHSIETYERRAVIDQNEEREAKIIDLLDRVLQAEEDAYGEIASLNDERVADEEIVSTVPEPIPLYRKSLGELSDAGSDASLSNAGLSRYDVIAQVHREDLPMVNEEQNEMDQNDNSNRSIGDGEQVTFFNESETASRTDESGYSDTTDKNNLNESTEELKQESEPYIPPPPPLNEKLFAGLMVNYDNQYQNRNNNNPYAAFEGLRKPKEEKEENKPRESLQSVVSYEGTNSTIVFGSERQRSFANKLSGILMKQVPIDSDVKGRKRSNSTGNVMESTENTYKDRPSLFLDLKKEIIAKDVAKTLRHVQPVENVNIQEEIDNKDDEEAMSRKELKSKLEGIFANGGMQLVKPRLMKSNPPTPEDGSSVENIAAKVAAKVDKSDTMKLQRAKFGEVLNSFRMSLSKTEQI